MSNPENRARIRSVLSAAALIVLGAVIAFVLIQLVVGFDW